MCNEGTETNTGQMLEPDHQILYLNLVDYNTVFTGNSEIVWFVENLHRKHSEESGKDGTSAKLQLGQGD